MNLSQLEYFRELYSKGSFLSASEKIGITQPALSLQIQKLEDELGYKLFDRNHRPIRLTVEGERFYEKAIDILRLVDELKEVSIHISEEIKGTLKVGIIPTLAPYLVPLIINELNNKYPSLILEITEIKTEEIIRKLKSGILDCGLMATPIEVKGIYFQALFYEKFYVYLSENHKLFNHETINPSSLEDKDLWYLEEGNCFQNQVNSICKFDNKNTSEQNLVYRSNSIESLRQIVESQSGATFIPELATIQIDPSHEDLIKDIEGEPPVREISLAATKTVTKERLINALKEIIVNNIPVRMLKKPKHQILDTKLSVK